MNSKQLLAQIKINNPELRRLIETFTNRMLGQIRQNLCKLNSINKREIDKLYYESGVTVEDFTSIVKEYPGGGHVMNDSLYTLLTLIAVRYELELDSRMCQTTSMLLTLVNLARLKYKYIRICDSENMKLTFSLMSRKTYIGNNGLIWGLYKISNDTFKKYRDHLLKNINDMYYRYRYIIDIRNKCNQLMKHIAQKYYWVMLNKNSIFTQEKIQKIANEIVEYVSTKEMNIQILELISKISKVDINKIYEFQHQLQLNNDIQNQIQLICVNLIEKLIKIKKFAESQQIEIDYNSEDFLMNFYTNTRRSSVLVALSNNSVFSSNGFPSLLILAFCSTIVIMWELLTKSNSSEMNTINNNNDMESDSFDSERYYRYRNMNEDINLKDDYLYYVLEENFSELVSMMSSISW